MADTVAHGPPRSSPPRRRHVLAHVTHVVGELLLTAGVVILLFVVYQLFWTGVETANAQAGLKDDLYAQWESEALPSVAAPTATAGPPETGPPETAPPAEPRPVDLGEGIGVIRIPRFGADNAWAVVEGVRVEDLRRGPGHYPGTALPGEVGNFAVAGHRTTYGAPFYEVESLQEGDKIVVETRTAWLTYAVFDMNYPVPVDSTWAVEPNPQDLGAPATRAIMTMTTCHPRFSAQYRFLVFSELVETLTKADGVVPAALAQAG
jgi:sortase A